MSDFKAKMHQIQIGEGEAGEKGREGVMEGERRRRREGTPRVG